MTQLFNQLGQIVKVFCGPPYLQENVGSTHHIRVLIDGINKLPDELRKKVKNGIKD